MRLTGCALSDPSDPAAGGGATSSSASSASPTEWWRTDGVERVVAISEKLLLSRERFKRRGSKLV